MATNPPKGDAHRNGAVRERSQFKNPQNDTWYKRDAKTGFVPFSFYDKRKSEQIVNWGK